MKSIELERIDLNLLVAFATLFEVRSVTLAARRLHLGQPAMSAALGRLRALFGDELFIRVGREMQPTVKAIAIAPGIISALQQIRQTIQSSQDFNFTSDSRDFAIGSADYTSFILIPPLLSHCRTLAPQLNFRMVEFEKDGVGDLLETGTIDVALGVFPNPPRQTICVPLFHEHFVGIARKNHPVIAQNSISLAEFVSLSHALVTLRRDITGEIDRALAQHGLQRRIALTVPHVLVLPSIIAATDLITAIPSRMANYFGQMDAIAVFDLPIDLSPWTVSMLWSKLKDQDDANRWLRQTFQTLSDRL